MAKKRIKVKRIHFLLDKIRYEKLLKCAGEYNTLTDILNKSIDGYYYSVYKTNELIDTSIPSNRGVVNQLQSQGENNSTTNEAEELEKLKAARRAKKEGASND